MSLKSDQLEILFSVYQLLMVQDRQTWYQINAKTYLDLRNDRRCKSFMIIVLNIYSNVRNERKRVMKLWGVPTKLVIL